MKLAGKHIMLIDDDEVLLKLLTRVLESAGCKVTCCTGTKEAMQQLIGLKPDLVFLDLNMPELDGFAFLKCRQRNKIMSLIPVIVLSGTQSLQDVQRAFQLGANQFLVKPFDARLILQKLKFIFYKIQTFTYRFPENDLPSVDAEISGDIAEHAVSRLKVESQVRFCAGKSVQVDSEDYVRAGGSTIVCKVDNHLVDLQEGFFRTVLSAVGQGAEIKKHFELWQKDLSR